jgi:hypothetical protein
MTDLAPGVMQFTVDSSCPDFSKIPEEEIIGNNLLTKEQQPSFYLYHTRSNSFLGVATM